VDILTVSYAKDMGKGRLRESTDGCKRLESLDGRRAEIFLLASAAEPPSLEKP
jgi:hypothetical protein